MGGAFIGLADDATAAYTNPAGLTILTQPEYGVEYKYTRHKNFLWDNNAPGGKVEFDDSVNGISFLSFAYPHKKSTISIYRHQLINSKTSGTASDYSRDEQIEGTTIGLATGLKVSDTLSLGFSVGFLRVNFYSLFFGDADGDGEQYTLSTLWSPLEKLSIGLVYRYGPEIDTTVSTNTGNIQQHLNIPDSYGLGISYMLLSNLTLCLDVNHIKYSELTDNLIFSDGTTSGSMGDVSMWQMDDVEQYRAGLEYVLSAGDLPLALRTGYSYTPSHFMQIHSPFVRQANPNVDYDEKFDNHTYSLGIGVVIDNIQIDIAGSIGDRSDEGILSFVYRFD